MQCSRGLVIVLPQIVGSRTALYANPMLTMSTLSFLFGVALVATYGHLHIVSPLLLIRDDQ